MVGISYCPGPGVLDTTILALLEAPKPTAGADLRIEVSLNTFPMLISNINTLCNLFFAYGLETGRVKKLFSHDVWMSLPDARYLQWFERMPSASLLSFRC